VNSTFAYGGNVHANGIRQHYLRYGGKGPAVILLPGITSPAITWGFVAERLGQHLDVYVLDVRGRGLSESRDDLDYSIDGCATDVPAFAEAVGLERCALLGHSFGARIAVRVASRYPDLVERMVIVDPPVSGPGRRRYPAKIEWYIESIRLMARGADHESLRPFLPTWNESQLRLRAEWLHTCSEKAVLDAYEDFHVDDMHADLTRLTLPTLLIVAGKGDVIRPEDATEMASLMPALSVVRVPEAGHMIPWDDEAGFMSALGNFLTSESATDPELAAVDGESRPALAAMRGPGKPSVDDI
jgi:N-formylmaleamate deformylase